MRKENVTPIGKPALVNPMNKGMDEQEQKGVTVPSKAANTFAHIPLCSPVFSWFSLAGRSSE